MKNDRRSAVTAASLLTALLLVFSVASCGKGDLINTDNKGLKSDDSLEYEVSHMNIEGADSIPESSEKSDPSRVGYDNELSSDAPKDTTSKKENKENKNKDAEKPSSDKKDDSANDNAVESNDAPVEIPYPDVEIFGDPNVGDNVPLNIVTINGVTMDTFAETVDTLAANTGTKQNKSISHYNFFNDEEAALSYDGVFFYGKGYGVDAQTQDESLRFTGTIFYVEGIRDGEELSMDVDARAEGVYGIRSIYSSYADIHDFDVEFANGVKCGMSRAAVEGLLGEGSTSKRYTYYANSSNVLLLGYSGETVSEIYLVNDYKRLPVRYSPSEKTEVKDDSSAASSQVLVVPATDEYIHTIPSSGSKTARSKEKDDDDQGE